MAGRKESQMTVVRSALLLLLLLLVTVTAPAHAHDPEEGAEEATEDTTGALPEILKSATFDQHLGETLPLDLTFRNEAGEKVALREYFQDGKPVILSMNYYECENLCPLVLDGLVRGLNGVTFKIGDEFNVVTVSIDPDESPELAGQSKRRFVERYGRGGAAERWGFLTGEQAEIDMLAEVAGVNFAYDEERDEWAHPSGVIIVTPEGTISRYIYGIELSPRDLRLALVEASEGRIGNPVDQVLLFCYRYDPSIGQYTPLVYNILKLGGVVTLAVMGVFLVPMYMRESRQKNSLMTGAAE